MKSINLTRKLARRTLISQNLFIAILPLGIIELLQYLNLIERNPYLIIIGLFSQPIIFAVLHHYRLRKNHDGKLLRKWEEKRQKRISESKIEISNIKSNLRERYGIVDIIPEPDQMCVFRITFEYSIHHKAMPEIFLLGVKLPVERSADSKIICYAKDAITSDIEDLVFQSGKSTYAIKNPYYMQKEIQPSDIIWQSEGNPREKNIFIKSSCFPHKAFGALYPFIFFIDGKRIGEYVGKHDNETNCLVINIGNINKRDCIGKKCIIKPAFDHRKRAELPHPMVISLNNTKVRQVSF